MKIWSFYDPETGLFVGRTFGGPERSLQANTPSGLAAVEGRHDHLSKRVDVASGRVIDWQPPQPSSDHEWDTRTRRWQLRREAAERLGRAAQARARIAELESKQFRAIRELALGQDDELAREARARLRAIDEEIASLRQDLV